MKRPRTEALLLLSCLPCITAVTPHIVLLRFADHIDRTLPEAAAHYRSLCADTAAAYLQEQSYGQYTVDDCVVHDWITLNVTESQVARPMGGLFSANRNADWFLPYVPDTTNIDHLIVMHSGLGAEAGECFAELNINPLDRILSQAYWESNVPGLEDGYAIVSGLDATCSPRMPATLGVFVHEWMHLLTAVDTYDFDLNRRSFNVGGLGAWDIMALPRGAGNDGTLPGSVGAYNKERMGWVEPIGITSNGEYTLRSVSLFPDIYRIDYGLPSTEYFLLEFRTARSYDALMEGNMGLLVTHVDLSSRSTTSSWQGQPDWPDRRYPIRLVQADDSFDLERGVNNGDSRDLWTTGRTWLARGYYEGLTGISVTVKSMTEDAMVIQVAGFPQVPTEMPTLAPTGPLPTITPTTLAPIPMPTRPPQTLTPFATSFATSAPIPAPTSIPTVMPQTPTAMPQIAEPTQDPTIAVTLNPTALKQERPSGLEEEKPDGREPVSAGSSSSCLFLFVLAAVL